ncbi:MAG: hypothetical protein QM727_15520 [Niabella sp.]
MGIAFSKRWFQIGVINLAAVALYGTLMRYKIAFDFPFLVQKNLLHAHSHFAFAGWISHVLYSGLAMFLTPYLPGKRVKWYNLLIMLNLVSAFGMLIAFTAQGYKAVSISFSTLSIFIAVVYAYIFITDMKYLPAKHPSKPWSITGLLLNIFSSIGPFSLAYMLASHHINHHLYLGSVYFYLHFQYSGWFFFGCMALVTTVLPSGFPSLKKYYYVFAATVIPTFFLSVLWAKLPLWLYVLTVIAALCQFFAWVILLVKGWIFFRQQITRQYTRWINVFFYVAAIALTLKFLLQAISVIPSLSQLVFGIRPIVIAYLHLVLLGVYSLFFIGFLFFNGWVISTKIARIASFAFLAGVVLNELLLAIQGFTAFAYIPVPYINQMLLVAALILLLSAIILSLSQIRKQML